MKRFALNICAVLCLVACAAGAGAWTPEYSMTPGMPGAQAPAIAIGPSGRIHCVYPILSPVTDKLKMYYRCCNGYTWSAPVDLAGPDYKEINCDIDVDSNDHPHIVASYRPGAGGTGPYTVHYWEFNGTSWSGPTVVSSGTHGDSIGAKIAVDRFNDLHIIWPEGGMTGGQSDIMYRKRQGGAWQAIQNVTANNPGTSYGSCDPDIAVDKSGNNVHVVWHDDFLNQGFQAYYTKNTNLGASGSWLPSAQWFQISTISYGKSPTIVLDRNDYPNVWWFDKLGTSDNRTCYRRWTGTAWTNIADWGTDVAFYGGVFDTGNRLQYVYTRLTPGGSGGACKLYYNTWDFSSFGSQEQVSTKTDTIKVYGGGMALDASGTAHALWDEKKDTAPENIYYAARTSFSPPDPISGFTSDPSDGLNRLNWTNPNNTNFHSTIIRYKTTGYPATRDDGFAVGTFVAQAGSSGPYTHSGLTNGLTYYYSAFTYDNNGHYSAAVHQIGAPRPMVCGLAKELADTKEVDMYGKVVTAIFADQGCIYVEELGRTSGIRVSHGGSGLAVGDRVNVSGEMATIRQNGQPCERQVAWPTVTWISSGTPLRPLAANCRAIGGAGVPPNLPGVADGVGLNNIGLLVKIAGKVTLTLGNYVYIDDGSGIDNGDGTFGVMVESPSAPTVIEGNIASAIGIIEGNIPAGWTENRRYIKLRSVGDLALVSSNMGAISGYVTDSDWNGISGATVSTTSGGYSTITNSAGAYTLTGVIAGEYTVEATRAGYTTASQNITLASDQNLNLDLIINPNVGTIQGLVRDSHSVGISGATVTTNTGGYTATTNSSGGYTITGVAAGAYNVTASKTGYVSQTLTNRSVIPGSVTYANFVLTATSGAAMGTETGCNHTPISRTAAYGGDSWIERICRGLSSRITLARSAG